MIRRRGWAVLAALLVAGCAKREAPSGGPPDIEPPRLVRSIPDSGRAGVPVDTRISLTFSEGMEPRSTADAVQVAPRLDIRQRRWNGRTLTLIPEQPLHPDHTYTVFVGNTARDRHGNDMTSGASVVFSTGAAFPAGRIAGRVDARGFLAPGTYIWCYEASRTGVPDSTGRDFDAVGLVDPDDAFRVDGLAVPGRYRLWAFADLNANRSFEPDRDVLVGVDTTLALTAGAPVADSLLLRLVNPRAPGRVRGVVLDSLADSVGVARVLAVSDADSSVRQVSDTDRSGAFELSLRAGGWTLTPFQDEDGDRAWRPSREPAGPEVHVTVEAAGDIPNLRLVLRRRSGAP